MIMEAFMTVQIGLLLLWSNYKLGCKRQQR
jgi:hypothetical protein